MGLLEKPLLDRLRCLTLGIGLAAAIFYAPGRALGLAHAQSAGPSAPPAFQVPVGSVDLRIDDTGIDEKLGGAFVLGLRSGANNCYVESLWQAPTEQGEISFVVKPPPHEGHYLVTLEKKGSISGALVDCVNRVFGGFYYYENKTAFDRVQGTLHFVPKLLSAPPPPTEAALRAALDARYSTPPVVRIVKTTLRFLSHDVADSQVFRRYLYSVELVFLADGYESTCHHYETYKVFTSKPYKTPYMGHSCESKARKAGDHTSDEVEIVYRLDFYPAIAKSWELRSSGITGTIPGTPQP